MGISQEIQTYQEPKTIIPYNSNSINSVLLINNIGLNTVVVEQLIIEKSKAITDFQTHFKQKKIKHFA